MRDSERPPADPPPEPREAASYIYLMVRELAPMARGAGMPEVARALAEVGDLAALALQRFGQPSNGDRRSQAP